MCYLPEMPTAFQCRTHSFAVNHSRFSTDITRVNRDIFRSCTNRKSFSTEVKFIVSCRRKRLFPTQYFIPVNGHNESGNIHVHIIFNSVRKLDVEKEPYMERDIDCRAGYKHHLTKGYLEYLKAEVMEMCEQHGLHQVDLLSPAKSKITDKEYRAQQRGQLLPGLQQPVIPQKSMIRPSTIMQILLQSSTSVLTFVWLLICRPISKHSKVLAYARKVKLSNLKEMARTVVYIQEHGYDSVGDLQKHRQQISGKKDYTQEALVQTDARIKEINEQIHFTGQYYATRQIQKNFLKARFKKKYREEHRTELDKYQEALSFFREHCDGKVPSMKELKAEKEKLLTLQSEQQKELSGFTQMERELQTAAANVENILLSGNISHRGASRNQPER